MRDHDVLFDKEQGRIAFVEAECTKDYVPSTVGTNNTTSVIFNKIGEHV
jgi:hypothetical protein